MKTLDFNWEELEDFLPVWDTLNVDDREAFLMLVETQPSSISSLGSFYKKLKKSGLILEMSDGLRCRLPDGLRSLKRALLALSNTEVFSSSNPIFSGDMLDYLVDHFASDELSRLGAGYYDRWEVVTRRAESVSWIRKFLDSDDEFEWEDKLNNQRNAQAGVWPDGAFIETSEVVRQLFDLRKPVSISEAMEASELPASWFLNSLYLGCRELLLFVDLCPLTKDLRVGIWPAVAERLNAPKRQMPKTISATLSFSTPVLLSDMYSLLTLCSSEPQRLRVNDGSLFAKSEKPLFETMVQGPWWLPFEYELNQGSRLRKAMAFALELDFLIGPAPRQRKNKPELKISSTGRQWMGLSEKNRLLAIWANFGLMEKGRASGYELGKVDLANFEQCFPYDWGAIESFDSPEWDTFNNVFKELFLDLAAATVDGFVDLNGFILYVDSKHNPFNRTGGDELWDFLFGTNWWGWRSEEEMEKTWIAGVLGFFVRWGAPLGLIALGTADPDIDTHSDGSQAVSDSFEDDCEDEYEDDFDSDFGSSGLRFSLCLKVTHWGRFILGLDEKLILRPESDADIIVQPNFEIVFLGASNEADIRLASVAERLGRGTGTLFRLTKASVQKAASSGMSEDSILTILTEVVSKPVPKNVIKQVSHWVGQAVLLHWRPAMVVTCPDHECALQVVGIVGKNAQLLSGNVVELTGGKPSATLVKKLQKVGFFLRAE